MPRFLKSVIDVRKGEVALTLLMLFNYYLILLSYYLLKPARDSLFLVKVSPELLPLVFIITALVAVPVTSLYSRASKKMKLNRVMIGTLAIIMVNLVILRWLVRLDSQWVYYLFYTWVSIYGALTTSQFWLLANAVFDSAQAKRIFTLIGLAGIIGAFTGGEVTNILVTAFDISTENLLFFCIGILGVVSLIVPIVWSKRPQDEARRQRVHRHRSGDGEEKMGDVMRTVFASRHLLLTVGIIAMTMMVASFVDYQFKTVSYEAFSTKQELTSFLGKFYGRLSLASLLIQLLFANRLIKWLGVGGIISFLPASLLIGSVALFAHPGLFAAVLLRGADGTFKYSVDKTGRELLFLPLSLEVKKKTKMFIDLFIDRWFRGLAGGLLLLLTLVIKIDVRYLSIIVIGLLMFWLSLVFLMRREYVNSFRKALEKRQIDLSELRTHINDGHSIDALIASLGSNNPRQIVYALEMLKSVRNVELIWPIRPLLQHKSSEVRIKALEALILHGDTTIVDDVEKLVEDDDPDVRCEAINFLAEHSPEGRTNILKDRLASDDPRVRNDVMACIARHGSEDEQNLFDEDFIEAVLNNTERESVQGRIQLARILGKSDPDRFGRYIDRLMNDESEAVVNAAIESLGLLKDDKHISWLLEKLGERHHRASARKALANYGVNVLETLRVHLTDRNIRFVIRQNIPRVIREIPDQKSVSVLTEAMKVADPGLKYHIVKGLNHLRIHNKDLRFNTEARSAVFIQETRNYYEIAQIIHLSGKYNSEDGGVRLLQRALIEKQRQNLERIFRLLGLVYPPNDMYFAYRGIVSREKTVHANAIEFLDNLLKSDVKKYIFPILDDTSTENVLHSGEELFNVRWDSPVDALMYLLEGRDSWLKACAIYAARDLDNERVRETISKYRDDPNPVVSETARKVTDEWKA